MSEMKARILEIADKKWVAGLQWRSYEDTPSKSELIEEANVIGADWCCERIRQPELVQCGYCEAVDGISPKKIYSLAASIADVERNPWLGIYKIDEDLYWFIAVRDNQSILPNGDIIGTEAEVKEALDAVSGMSDWTILEGDFERLESILKEEVKKPTPVRSLFGPSPWIAPAIALSMAVIIGIGVFAWWQHHEKQLEQERRQAQIEAMKAAKLKEQLKNFQTELQKLPFAQDVVSSCESVYDNLPVSYYGWLPKDISCTDRSATVNWAKGGNATVAHLPKNADFNNAGTMATQTFNFGFKHKSNNDVQDLFISKQQFMGAMQKYGAEMSFSAPPPLPPIPQNGNGAQPHIRPLPSVLFTLSLSNIPHDYNWNSVPGLRVKTMHYNGIKWNITGVIYGKR